MSQIRSALTRPKIFALLLAAALAVALSIHATATTARVENYNAPLQVVGLMPAPGYPGFRERVGTEGFVKQSLCVSLSQQNYGITCSITRAKVAIVVTFGAPATFARTSCGKSEPVTGAAELRIVGIDDEVFA